FFFQAEDGIRDLIVTGVQTCALPISIWRSAGLRPGPKQRVAPQYVPGRRPALRTLRIGSSPTPPSPTPPPASSPTTSPPPGKPRSEERRVGKECRSRGGADDEKKQHE